MAWSYEIRGVEDRLVEIGSGFATEREAFKAGERSKDMIGSICYPNCQTLTLVTNDDGNTPSRLPPSLPENAPHPRPNGKHETNLKYPWQKAVLDAFMEPHPQNLPGKINVAERAISTRLLESDRFELQERIALGEALLTLRRLLCEQEVAKDESHNKKGVA